MIINSDRIRNYRKAYIDLSYDSTETYKGVVFKVDFYNNNGELVTSKAQWVAGYTTSPAYSFDRKIISIDLDESIANTINLKLKCYTCETGSATTYIYNLWFE